MLSPAFSDSDFSEAPGNGDFQMAAARPRAGTPACRSCWHLSLATARGQAVSKFSFQTYSVRKAAIGLIRVARRAGSQVATRVAAPSTSGAVENAIGSSEPTW